MIIWLASYPKSGNTWVRSFINSLIFTEDGSSNINHLKIGQFPNREHFINLISNLDTKNNLKELSKNWIIAQNIINLSVGKKFFKTHHSLCKIYGNNFTDLKNTDAVIHVVRDPRNVITSLKNHYQKNNYAEALDFLLDENRIIYNEDNTGITTLVGSWKSNYNSWKKFPKNYFLIKYENLIENPDREFFKLSEFLIKLLNFKINKDKIKKAIISNDFENLQLTEKKEGFKESLNTKYNDKRKNFFNLGPNNKWEKLLDNDTKIRIENNFKDEMQELGYL